MPPRSEVSNKFTVRTDRVKSVDVHPVEPWVLASLFSGNLMVWNYATQSTVKQFEVCDVPVRAGRFIARRQQVVCGADDFQLRVYDMNTMEKVKQFEAHTDYIRCVAVHPSRPLVLSCADDLLIKLWDWDANWACTQVFEGHQHFVMQVVFNPKDPNTFASASLDSSVKIWSLTSPVPNYTLDGPEMHGGKGVNFVDYFPGADRPYLATASDDMKVKVWDYQSRSCVQTLEGHTDNVSCVVFHPSMPFLLSGSEDGTVRVWHMSTFKMEATMSYNLDRCWVLGAQRGGNKIAAGFDLGVVLLKMGHSRPVMSMDAAGRLIWIRGTEVFSANVRAADASAGDRLAIAPKEMGSCELFAQNLRHSPNGRFVAAVSEGEYIIYTALAWRSKTFGQGEDLVWSADSARYAVREWGRRIKLFHNFEERETLTSPVTVEAVFGGALLAVASRECLLFYDWESLQLVRRVDGIFARRLFWNDAATLVAVVTDGATFVLRFNRQYRGPADDAGFEDAFDVEYQIAEQPRGGCWVGECFVYTASGDRLRYMVGGHAFTAHHFEAPMYFLGYLKSDGRAILSDKEVNVLGVRLDPKVLEYMSAVVQGDEAAASELLPHVPNEHRNVVARFLESQDRKELALSIAVDPDLKFDLAVATGRLDVALAIAASADSDIKWKALGDMALQKGEFEAASMAFRKAHDINGLFLISTALADGSGLREVAQLAREAGKFNVAFACLFALRDVHACVELLVESGRLAEAAFFARSYCPGRISEVVAKWRQQLARINPRASEAIADPVDYPNLFPSFEHAAAIERRLAVRGLVGKSLPSQAFEDLKDMPCANLLEAFLAGELGDEPAAAAAAAAAATDAADETGVAAAAAAAPAVAAPHHSSPGGGEADDGAPGGDSDGDGSDERMSTPPVSPHIPPPKSGGPAGAGGAASGIATPQGGASASIPTPQGRAAAGIPTPQGRGTPQSGAAAVRGSDDDEWPDVDSDDGI